MIVVCDINEIWRKKPFAAMAEQADVLGVAPADWLIARQSGNLEFSDSSASLKVLNVSLPLSWASRTAWVGQRILWRKMIKFCKKNRTEISTLIVTSPHYLPLLSLIPNDIKTIYYASDDYHSYEGWNRVAALEKDVIERVDHAFFISHGLMERAHERYGISLSKLSVSMNATEPRFMSADDQAGDFPEGNVFKRPVAGVVGGIGDRLDFSLLFKCAALEQLGTLLLVGPLPSERSPELQALLDHPKCMAVGAKPHDEIHQWFQGLDIGLIPYVDTEFNRLCSPMRLFDHLASGAWIVATDACEQICQFKPQASICKSAGSFVEAVEECCSKPRLAEVVQGVSWADRASAMLSVIRS